MNPLPLVLALILIPCGLAAQPVKRTLHALVIGCDYQGTRLELPSPVRDAERVAETLATPAIGFRVTLLKNPDRRAFLEAVETFGEVIAREQGVGLFYFSGHGMQHDGENYLVPAAADPRFREDLPTDCVAASRVMVRMTAAGNGTNLLFLDACRDSPLPSARVKGAVAPGLAQMSGSGLLIGFAADSGKVALDSGQGSRYTNALLKHLPTPGISVAELLTRVRRDVITDTGRAQEPFVYMGLDELFSFVPGSGGIGNDSAAAELARLREELARAKPMGESSSTKLPSDSSNQMMETGVRDLEAGRWEVIEEVTAKNGGHRISWRYDMFQDSAHGNSLIGAAEKSTVNEREPTAKETAALAVLQIRKVGSERLMGAVWESNGFGEHFLVDLEGRWNASNSSFEAVARDRSSGEVSATFRGTQVGGFGKNKNLSEAPLIGGFWTIREFVEPSNGGYDIEWRYQLQIDNDGLTVARGSKVRVNHKPAKPGEVASNSVIRVSVNPKTGLLEGSSVEISPTGSPINASLVGTITSGGSGFILEAREAGSSRVTAMLLGAKE